MSSDLLLEMKNISKRFPGVQALDNVNLEVYKGEKLALVGENGAGKSTLMKILIGLIRPDAGEIIYKGEKIKIATPADALSRGICMIHQEISLVPTMTVAENIWLGREKLFRSNGFLSKNLRNTKTKELLDQLEIGLDPFDQVSHLSVANMQLVELARAVSYDSEIIIMDEPTSALADKEIKNLFRIVNQLVGQGKTIIFISHKLDEIFAICDRVAALRDGQSMGTHKCTDISTDDLVKIIVGRELTSKFPKEDAEIGEVALEVRHLTSNKIKDVSFSVRKGEILGVSGLIGAGRSEIAQAIYGLDRATSGEILIDGKKVKIKKPFDAVRAGIGMVTEDRLRLGLMHRLSIKTNITLPYLYTITSKLGFVNKKKEDEDCNRIVRILNVKFSSLNQAIAGLSGGNQQKAIISRWLLSKVKILILDEPTRGIDVGSKSEVHREISHLAQQGIAVIMISSELPEILGMSDKVIVVREGQIVSEQSREEATQESLIKCAFGLSS